MRKQRAIGQAQAQRTECSFFGHVYPSQEEAEALREAANEAKRARHEDRDLAALTEGAVSESQRVLLEKTLSTLLSAEREAGVIAGAGAIRRSAGEEKQLEAKRTELTEALDRMTLRSVAKVTQKRVYSMVYHPTLDQDLIFVGDKEGAVGIWNAVVDSAAQGPDGAGGKDAEGEGEEKRRIVKQGSEGAGAGEDEEEGDADLDGVRTDGDGQVWRLQVHGKSPIPCMKLDPISSNKVSASASAELDRVLSVLTAVPHLALARKQLYTSNYEGTIRALDFQTGQSTEVYAGDEDVLLSIFDVLLPGADMLGVGGSVSPSLGGRTLWIADHRGGLTCQDIRERPTGRRSGSNVAPRKRWQVCEKKVGGMSVNASCPYAIACAGLDQMVRLFDTRALRTVPTTEEAPYSARGVDMDQLRYTWDKALMGSHKTKQAATSVDWDPTGTRLLATSYDDTVKGAFVD